MACWFARSITHGHFVPFNPVSPLKKEDMEKNRKNIHTVDGQIYIQYVYMKKYIFFLFMCVQ